LRKRFGLAVGKLRIRTALQIQLPNMATSGKVAVIHHAPALFADRRAFVVSPVERQLPPVFAVRVHDE
jgi:hypothetical protein